MRISVPCPGNYTKTLWNKYLSHTEKENWDSETQRSYSSHTIREAYMFTQDLTQVYETAKNIFSVLQPGMS